MSSEDAEQHIIRFESRTACLVFINKHGLNYAYAYPVIISGVGERWIATYTEGANMMAVASDGNGGLVGAIMTEW